MMCLPFFVPGGSRGPQTFKVLGPLWDVIPCDDFQRRNFEREVTDLACHPFCHLRYCWEDVEGGEVEGERNESWEASRGQMKARK